MKLGVVGGAGLLGSTSAFLAGMKGYLEEIKLLDVKENLVKNHVMDMAQAIYSSSDTKVTFAQYKDLSDCGAILITASLPERKVANRLEYLWDNMNIIKPVCESIRENCPHQPVIINATNPVDIFNYIIWKELGWDRKKIVGFNGNDTYRLKWAASIVTGKPFSDIDGFAIGEHGNGQINLYDKMTCGGEPLGLTGDEIGKIESITANFFSEMNALNSGRTSGWTSAVNIESIIETVAKDSGRVLECSAVLEGEYGLKDVSLGIPVAVGAEGIKEYRLPDLTEEQAQRLEKVSEAMKEIIREARSA